MANPKDDLFLTLMELLDRREKLDAKITVVRQKLADARVAERVAREEKP